MDRRRYWRVVVWGSGFGADGGLRITQEEADDAVEYLIQKLGWKPQMVSVEELDLYPFRARDARMAKCKPVHPTEGAEMQR